MDDINQMIGAVGVFSPGRLSSPEFQGHDLQKDVFVSEGWVASVVVLPHNQIGPDRARLPAKNPD